MMQKKISAWFCINFKMCLQWFLMVQSNLVGKKRDGSKIKSF